MLHVPGDELVSADQRSARPPGKHSHPAQATPAVVLSAPELQAPSTAPSTAPSPPAHLRAARGLHAPCTGCRCGVFESGDWEVDRGEHSQEAGSSGKQLNIMGLRVEDGRR